MKKKIALICRTPDSLEQDDRIRKECESLKSHYDIIIYVIYENNRAEDGVTSYGIKYKSFALKSRTEANKGKSLLSKSYDFFKTVRPYLEGFDYIWLAEEYTFIFGVLLRHKKIIWDLHELPSYMMYNWATRLLFQFIERKSYKIIHANEERIRYLIAKKVIKQPQKHYVVHNYPDSVFLDSEVESTRNIEFQEWLQDDSYVYLQGLDFGKRYPLNTIKALMDTVSNKILVVGRFDKEAYEQLIKEYGEKLEKRVFFMGTIPSIQIPLLMKNARFSVVFYTTDDPNSRFCEANRFYNAICLGVPVVVGCNESMANICKTFKNGCSIQSDGRNINDIVMGINDMMLNYDEYKMNCIKNSTAFRWSDEPVMKVFE
jgi:hypothetical protein